MSDSDFKSIDRIVYPVPMWYRNDKGQLAWDRLTTRDADIYGIGYPDDF